MNSFEIRAAKEEDCPALARLIQIAHGQEYFDSFHDGILPPGSADSYLREGLKQANSILSYQNSLVAVSDNTVVGGVIGFPSEQLFTYQDMQAFYGEQRVRPLKEVFEPLPADSYYCYALAMFPEAVRCRAGMPLMKALFDRANSLGYLTMYFHAWDDDTRRIRAFQGRLGAQIIKKITVPPSRWIPSYRNCSVLLRVDCSRC